LLVCVGALLWAYVTACFVDMIVNSNPEIIHFRNAMDDLNRSAIEFCS